MSLPDRLREHATSTLRPDEAAVGLAQELGWSEAPSSVESIRPRGSPCPLARAYLSHEPALLVALTSELSDQLRKFAGLFAYHSTVEWCLLADQEGALVLNSHRLLQGDWYTLPPIRWDQASEYEDVFEALTPGGLSTGGAERVSSDYVDADRELRPVDEALVERLDHWRDHALRLASRTEGIDEALQILFAQFFVLRAIEDRRTPSNLPPLQSVLDERGLPELQALRSLLARARETVQSELFAEDVAGLLPLEVTGGIVRDLYTPAQEGLGQYRYNFSWIDADVLGRAYEKFLATVLVPASRALIAQARLWEDPKREVERVSVQRARGVYYTPDFLVDFLVDTALQRWSPDGFGHDKIPRIVDFSCGSGSFLVAAVDRVARELGQRNADRNWARHIIENRRVFGVDIDERAVVLARLSLWLRFAEEPDPLPLPELNDLILSGDALDPGTWDAIPNDFDLVLGNPPFLPRRKISDVSKLEENFDCARGRFDYSHLFLELAVRMLRPGGILAMVVPNRVFTNYHAGTIRQLLAENLHLDTILDFQDSEVFLGANAYIGAIVATKRPEGEPEEVPDVHAIRVDRLQPKYMAARLRSALRCADEYRDEWLQAFAAPQPRADGPWLLLSPTSRQSRGRLLESSIRLSEIAGVFQGIKTGGNDLFMVEVLSSLDRSPVLVRNGLGDEHLVEREVLRPCVSGSDLQRYHEPVPTRFLVYPYRDGRVLTERELEKEFPKAKEYFRRSSSNLKRRASIQGRGMAWYELAWERSEEWLRTPKLLSKELATQTAFALDLNGDLYLVGGTAVVPLDSADLLWLVGYLNSAVATWYLERFASTFRSGFLKFEPRHLSDLPIPESLISGELASEVEERVLQRLDAGRAGNEELAREIEAMIDTLLTEDLGIVLE